MSVEEVASHRVEWYPDFCQDQFEIFVKTSHVIPMLFKEKQTSLRRPWWIGAESNLMMVVAQRRLSAQLTYMRYAKPNKNDAMFKSGRRS